MSPDKRNPTLAVQCEVGPGDVVCLAASDKPMFISPLVKRQQDFVARRSRLQPEIARVVASLAFGGAA